MNFKFWVCYEHLDTAKMQFLVDTSCICRKEIKQEVCVQISSLLLHIGLLLTRPVGGIVVSMELCNWQVLSHHPESEWVASMESSGVKKQCVHLELRPWEIAIKICYKHSSYFPKSDKVINQNYCLWGKGEMQIIGFRYRLWADMNPPYARDLERAWNQWNFGSSLLHSRSGGFKTFWVVIFLVLECTVARNAQHWWTPRSVPLPLGWGSPCKSSPVETPETAALAALKSM
jgi:hypothetical protein